MDVTLHTDISRSTCYPREQSERSGPRGESRPQLYCTILQLFRNNFFSSLSRLRDHLKPHICYKVCRLSRQYIIIIDIYHIGNPAFDIADSMDKVYEAKSPLSTVRVRIIPVS